MKAIRRFDDRSGTWVGIAAAIAGFVLIGVAWGQANDAHRVEDQVGPLIGFGLTGLGLIAVGVALVGLVARRQDADRAARQAEELADVLRQLGGAVHELEGRVDRGRRADAATPAPRRSRRADAP